jgi:hypothetical protein
LLPNVSGPEKLDDTAGGEDGTSAGKVLGMCIVWEKDIAGVKSLSVNKVLLKKKIPVVEKAGCSSSGVIDHGCFSMYS